MVCIQCGSKTEVVNSRTGRRSNQVWRRRHCTRCGALFTTEERADYEAAWAVRSPQGRLEPFSRDKLLVSLYRSLRHRPAALRDAGALADTIINKLRAQAADGVLESRIITGTARVALNRFDHAASVAYQAFHA
jgi:transcriptional repressor NrdR